MKPTQIVIEEELDGTGFIRLTQEVLQKLGVGVGDCLYLVEADVQTYRTLVFSKTPSIPDRTDGMFLESRVSEAERQLLSVRSLKGAIAKLSKQVDVEEMSPSWPSLADLPKAEAEFLQKRPEIVPRESIIDLLACPGSEDFDFEPGTFGCKDEKE